MEAEKAALDRLTPPQRLALAVEAIDWTLQTMGTVDTDEVRDYLDQVLPAARSAVEEGKAKVQLSDELLDRYESVDELADEPGTSHLLSAVLACCDTDDGLDSAALFGVLSFCYEGSLDREDLPEWSPEAERENARCLDVIAFQKALIARSAP